MPRGTLELGKFLVDELKEHGNPDTLTVWLLHYIAELIVKAESEPDSPLGIAARREACEMILRLWEHRATFTGRANPMEEYGSALKLLHSLRKEGFFVFGGLEERGDPVDAFRAASAALLSSMVVLRLPDESDGKDVAVRNLSKLERQLTSELNIIRIRTIASRADLQDEDSVDPREVLKNDALEDITRLRKALDAIEADLGSVKKSATTKRAGPAKRSTVVKRAVLEDGVATDAEVGAAANKSPSARKSRAAAKKATSGVGMPAKTARARKTSTPRGKDPVESAAAKKGSAG
jgi:hypothetical protein